MDRSNIMSKLKFHEIRKIENEAGVFLVERERTHKTPNQQFSVFKNTEDEPYVGEVTAQNLFFTREELRVKIMEMREMNGFSQSC